MVYDEERSVIIGLFSINHSYKDVTIKDSFNIEIRLSVMKNREEYPDVYNTDGRIKKIAKRKNLKNEDLHVYADNRLCLGLPIRFYEYYPNGFNLQQLFIHLSEHLYWVAYYERYNTAPWPAELHGEDALVEYYFEVKDVDEIRSVYRKRFGIGISKQKIRNYLQSESQTNILKQKILQNGWN